MLEKYCNKEIKVQLSMLHFVAFHKKTSFLLTNQKDISNKKNFLFSSLWSDFQEFVILKLDFSLMFLLNLLHSYQDFVI
ncbi:hypothetical protein BpHYR1_052662 [Brachionus plicatilis]|uniref:Uncharacterized protein n=1 Tax=Brachionus plicatilis TaxID=10195 RepID=A0A3M7Q833_BRAPC|nr:hypothetical protein BpHYR1_052662 [Brachionus plicatilis]